ncbi:MAG: hypothetical protein D6732_04405, partial [Methanobacteriota archaeon]
KPVAAVGRMRQIQHIMHGMDGRAGQPPPGQLGIGTEKQIVPPRQMGPEQLGHVRQIPFLHPAAQHFGQGAILAHGHRHPPFWLKSKRGIQQAFQKAPDTRPAPGHELATINQ